jgi:exodeoxyribonuclease-5
MKINLNNEQQNIFNELHNFVFNKSNKTKLYLLTGLAGTGKTFLISYFLTLHELKNKKIAVTGCTNKAVGVLESSFLKTLDSYKITNNKDNTDKKDNEDSNYSRLTFLTIHKLLQIKRKIDSNGEEIFESSIDENNIKITSKSIFFYDLIIVDEVSMLSKDLTLQILRLHQKIKGKIIFLGDKAQLPPVREPESHIFELAGTQIPQGSLQKIMRSGDQIIDFVNSIRILIDNYQHKVPFKKLANNISPNDTISRIS